MTPPRSARALERQPRDDRGAASRGAPRIVRRGPPADAARARCEAYLEALGVAGAARPALARRAVERAARAPSDSGPIADALSALREIVVEEFPVAGEPAARPDPFLSWRLAAALAGGPGGLAAPDAAAAVELEFARRGTLRFAPPLRRGRVVPHHFERRGGRQRLVPEPERPPRTGAWRGAALRRRLLLGLLVAAPSVAAGAYLLGTLPQQGRTGLEVAIAIFFGALFAWISIGFWTAAFGFLTLVRRRDRFAPTANPGPELAALDPEARVALVMPICDEPVDRVFAGLRAMHRSLAREGALERFDFFVLSDSADPDLQLREQEAWLELCRRESAFGRVFYRRRRVRIARKSGNVADFCRRWGSRYRYMVMLDADSVMSGPTLVRLLRCMEAHPRAAVIQTTPISVGRRSLFARVQQFSSRVYGPLFSAGLHFWQLGEGQYWGHNAILRTAPFMEHCGLPDLPGGPPLGGEILSHDFVEAALLGRAGYELWLAHDLPGSFEETPATLLEEMRRDRRWCQGNLQHLKLLRTKGLVGAHRALFLNGVLSYLSAALWFAFLCLGTAEAIWHAVGVPDYFPDGRGLFPVWPVWHGDRALLLVAVTGALLFVPKLLGVLLVLGRRGSARRFGGVVRLGLSALVEGIASALLAPIRMVFHTRFVLANLVVGIRGWRSQARVDTETRWRDAVRHHGLDTLVASAWALGVRWLNPEYFWWLTPVVAALLLSIPLSVLASRVRLGDAARRIGLLRIPEETDPPVELQEISRELRRTRPRLAPAAARGGFARAIADPGANALQRAVARGARRLRPEILAARRTLAQRALAEGPECLSLREQRMLLGDARILDELHRAVWALPEAEARAWGTGGDGQLANA